MPKNNIISIIHKNLNTCITQDLEEKLMEKFAKQLEGKDIQVKEFLHHWIDDQFRDPGKKRIVARNKSGYNLFMADKRIREIAKLKAGKNAEPKDVMGKMSEIWKGLPEKEKKKYNEAAKKENDAKITKKESEKEESEKEESEKEEESEKAKISKTTTKKVSVKKIKKDKKLIFSK